MTRLDVKKSYFIGALLYVFLIPFPQKLVSVALIIWGILSLVSFSRNALVKNNHLWLLPAFYATYFIGVFTSETVSFKFLEYKLALLVFPFLFSLHVYDDDQRERILKVFVWGLFASVATCFVWAIYNSIGILNGNLVFQPNVLEGRGFIESILFGGNYFFGRYLSIFHQTVYYATYLCAGVAILLFVPKLFSSKLWITLISIFIVFIFLISNKASFIVLALIFGLKIYKWNVNRNKKVIGVSFFTLALVVFIFLNPRIKESVVNIAEGNLVLNKEARYGFSTRLLSWDTAVSLIKEKPIFGYGYRESQNVLNMKYEEKGYIYPLRESYNAHNLWLQSWLENGLLAVVILFGIFFILFHKSWHYPLFFTFALIFLTNSLFEGLFNRFSGISFFSFLVCFIFSASKGGQVKV